MFKKYPQLNGAWEEPGVIGNRIEIEGSKIVILWRNSPTLETGFSVSEEDGGLLLKLKKTGLSYTTGGAEYANVTRIFYKDEKLEFVKYFPITGESKDVLKKTANSRYGNYEICDEILKELQGEWENERGYMDLTIKKDVMTMNGDSRKIHVLKPAGESGERYVIADHDPSVYEWRGLTRFEYYGGVLHTNMIICDGPTVTLNFTKKKS